MAVERPTPLGQCQFLTTIIEPDYDESTTLIWDKIYDAYGYETGNVPSTLGFTLNRETGVISFNEEAIYIATIRAVTDPDATGFLSFSTYAPDTTYLYDYTYFEANNSMLTGYGALATNYIVTKADDTWEPFHFIISNPTGTPSVAFYMYVLRLF